MPDERTIDSAVAVVRQFTPETPRIGIVTGSGFALLADLLTERAALPWPAVPGLTAPSVPGHPGELVIGRLGDQVVAMMRGRLHFYEGLPMKQVCFPVSLLQALGVEILILTNAAGGLNPTLKRGDIMLVTDHINLPGLAGHSPLMEMGHKGVRRFLSLTEVYDPELRRAARMAAARLGLELPQGVYVMVAGPSFETPAELRFLRAAGADAVGMSTVPEVIAGRYLGMRVLVFSCITNLALGIPEEVHEVHARPMHEEVLSAGREIAPRLASLVEATIQVLGEQRQ